MQFLHKFLFLLTFLSLFFIQAQQKNSTTSQKLVFLTEISRHGARSPMYPVLNSEQVWKKVLPPFSQLTQVGERQHYLLGRQFRQTYIEEQQLLDIPYNDTQILVETTGVSRTQMSAKSQLLGWFFDSGEGLSENQTLNPQLDFPPQFLDDKQLITEGEQILKDLGKQNLPMSYQPFPSYSCVNSEFNFITEPNKSCPKIDYLKKQAQQSILTSEFNDYLNAYDFYTTFRSIFGIPDSQEVGIELVGQYYDTLYCNQFQQIPFPENLNEEDWEWIQFVYNFQQLYLSISNEMSLKLQVSKFFEQVIKEIKGAIQGDSGRRFLYFSGSDTNLNPINTAFGIVSYATNFQEWKQNQFKYSNAPFASTILIEVYEDENYKLSQIYEQKGNQFSYDQYSVVYKYNGVNMNDYICGSNSDKEPCPLGQFFKNMEQYILTQQQYDENCIVNE